MGNFHLETARLRFRSWTEDDADLANDLWGDPLVTRLIDSRGPLSREHVLARLETELAHEREHGVQYWPMFLISGPELAGCCGLRPHQPADADFELGFHLRPQFWGQGLAGEAARAVIGYAFHTLGAKTLFAGHHPDNVESKRLLGKLGFRPSGSVFYPPTGLVHPSYLLHRERWSLDGPRPEI